MKNAQLQEFDIVWGKHRLALGKKTLVMGVLNITPDSFSDGGLFFDPENALSQARRMVQDGADILDIGGESTRPGSDSVSAGEELARVIPVVKALADTVSVPISIDTTKARVAREALAAGAAMINDISAMRVDPEIGDVAAEFGVPLVLMHMQGQPKTMQVAPVYENLIGEIKAFLVEAMDRAVSRGVLREKLIVDPGIGFGKTFDHNFSILKHLQEFRSLNAPILVGSSRKAFIRRTLNGPEEGDIDPQSPIVAVGTQATIAAAALNGAQIIRVHDVAETCATLKMIDAVKNAV